MSRIQIGSIGNGYSIRVDNNGIVFNGKHYPFPKDIENKGSLSIINSIVKVGNYRFDNGEWVKEGNKHAKRTIRGTIYHNNATIHHNNGNREVTKRTEMTTPLYDLKEDVSKTSLMSKLKNIFK